MKPERVRVLWCAGTRSEALALGPYYLELRTAADVSQRLNWFGATGEQGVALYQALDDAGVRPDEEAEVRHPAEDPAARLKGLIEEIENLARRHRATHVVFAGGGPTAVAAALVCHARGVRGVWLAPTDPAGLIPRLGWERGLDAVIRALPDAVKPVESSDTQEPCKPLCGMELPPETPKGRRGDAPLALLAVTRPGWGAGDVPERFVAAASDWARAMPEGDWLFLRSLDARFEGPIRAMAERPENFLTAPPVPYQVYRRWLTQVRVVLTDSWAIAAEALRAGIPVGALAEEAARPGRDQASVLAITPADLRSDRAGAFLGEAVRGSAPRGTVTGLWGVRESIRRGIERALGE
jgi:hypothetical protein